MSYFYEYPFLSITLKFKWPSIESKFKIKDPHWHAWLHLSDDLVIYLHAHSSTYTLQSLSEILSWACSQKNRKILVKTNCKYFIDVNFVGQRKNAKYFAESDMSLCLLGAQKVKSSQVCFEDNIKQINDTISSNVRGCPFSKSTERDCLLVQISHKSPHFQLQIMGELSKLYQSCKWHYQQQCEG